MSILQTSQKTQSSRKIKHILFLSQLIPYPIDAGPKVRSYYTLRHLAQHHDVTLLAFARLDDRTEAINHLREFCRAVYTLPMQRTRKRDAIALVGSLLSGESFVIRRDYFPEMARKIDELLDGGQRPTVGDQPFDAVHADQLWMAQYALRAKRINVQRSNVKIVLDEHNACFQIFQRLAQRELNPFKRALLEIEWRALKRYEARTCAQFDHVVTVTDDDRQMLANLVRDYRAIRNSCSEIKKPLFTTIPICIDSGTIQPVTPRPNGSDVLHMGTMFFLPNVEGVLWFGREVWPRVQAHVPDATFTIVGKNPPRAVRELSAISDKRLENGYLPQIRVTGYVADPKPYLERASVFIVPLLSGGGMRVKILDAWRWGLPVVSTCIGAEGIDYIDGENILIADAAEAFAQSVVRVLQQPELASRLRQNGRRWVEEHYNWRSVYPAWDEIYQPKSGRYD